MMKLVFLCSGGGGNLKFAVKALQGGLIEGIEINHVYCDRPCGAHDFSKKCEIPTTIQDFLIESQNKIAHEIKHLNVNLVVCNLKKILSDRFIQICGCDVVNLHYSLLPAFPGTVDMKPLKKALIFGSRIVGATLHRVTPELDMGPPLVQAAIPVTGRTDERYLENLLFEAGALCLLSYLNSRASGHLGVPVGFSLSGSSSPVLLNPSSISPELMCSVRIREIFEAVRAA